MLSARATCKLLVMCRVCLTCVDVYAKVFATCFIKQEVANNRIIVMSMKTGFDIVLR